jgi:endonuclease YncB( thermonuclease family)
VHVADGDTITVLKSGKKGKVRLCGINTPEKAQWYGRNAKTFTSSQVMGKTVDVQEIDVDRYGRAVGVVTVGDRVLDKHLATKSLKMIIVRNPTAIKRSQKNVGNSL